MKNKGWRWLCLDYNRKPHYRDERTIVCFVIDRFIPYMNQQMSMKTILPMVRKRKKKMTYLGLEIKCLVREGEMKKTAELKSVGGRGRRI